MRLHCQRGRHIAGELEAMKSAFERLEIAYHHRSKDAAYLRERVSVEHDLRHLLEILNQHLRICDFCAQAVPKVSSSHIRRTKWASGRFLSPEVSLSDFRISDM